MEHQIPLNSILTWIKPPPLRVKLNSDGSCSNGQSGGGGIIRDQKGDFIFAYSIPLGNGTSNTAEAEALLYGLQWCASKGIEMAIGETDSLLFIQNCKKRVETPLENQQTEANKPADALASLSHKIEEIKVFTLFSNLPSNIRGLINMDKWSLPSFRQIKIKPSHFVYDPP
ncbi:hypothetical protein KY289_018181 [Solanum tuberosum]|nr:hypothetical protein KY289_018181 [Solanum tuberosum]